MSTDGGMGWRGIINTGIILMLGFRAIMSIEWSVAQFFGVIMVLWLLYDNYMNYRWWG